MISHLRPLTIDSGLGHWHDDLDGRRTRPFATLPDLVLHRLAFSEFFKGHAFRLRVVKEQVVPFTFDESKTSIRNQLSDLTLWHFCPPLKKA
jgi:hypothetical protein